MRRVSDSNRIVSIKHTHATVIALYKQVIRLFIILSLLFALTMHLDTSQREEMNKATRFDTKLAVNALKTIQFKQKQYENNMSCTLCVWYE